MENMKLFTAFGITPLLLFMCLCVQGFASYSVEKLSLEEKIGQLLMVYFNGDLVNEDAKILVQEVKVGGIIYYRWANGLYSPQQVRNLSEGLQGLAQGNCHQIPLLIAVDQEGGDFSRLQEGFTRFPGNKTVGETGNLEFARDVAFAMGKEMLAVGINMNLAPVVDVNSNPLNCVIGTRSFGENPESVTAFGEKALDGYRRAGVIATLKHFPGYGDVEIDPHKDLPILCKSKQELEAVELLPFARLAAFADAVMTAHILVPALDAENCSTLSEKTLKYLREVIGFTGVIVADSLVMEGVIKQCHTVDEAAILALNAGCDILLLGGKLFIGESVIRELTVSDVRRVHDALIEAVKTGRILEDRVNEAVNRIFVLKTRNSDF